VAGNTALAPRPSITVEPDPAPSLSVVPAAEAPSPRTPFVVLVLFLIGAGLVGLLLLNTAIAENAFRLHSLEKEKKVLDLQEQQLERDLRKVDGPGPLAAAANRLGLVPEGQPAYIQLPEGRIVGVPTPAKAVPRHRKQPASGPGAAGARGQVPGPGSQAPPAVGGSVQPGAAATGPANPAAGQPPGGGW
jgi:hypothetical protein